MADVCSLPRGAAGIELGTRWLENSDPSQDVILDSISMGPSQNMSLVGQYAMPAPVEMGGLTGASVPLSGVLDSRDIAEVFPAITELSRMVVPPDDGVLIVAVFAPKAPGRATLESFDLHYHAGGRGYVQRIPDGLTFDDTSPECQG